MSGYKRATVTISEDEYRRLHEADMKHRFKEHRKKKTKKTMQPADLTGALRQMEDRQRELEQAIAGLDDSLDLIESEMMREMVRQNAICYENLMNVVEQSASANEDSLAFISQRFTEEMQREREQYQHDLQSLVRELDFQEQREQAKAESARQWMRQAEIQAGFIQAHYDDDRFAPGRLPRILRNLALARNNLEEGFLESSRQVSQQAVLELADLHFDLEQQLVAWQTEYERAQNALEQFTAELELNRQVSAFGLDGEELAEQVDLSEWSKGAYDQLGAACLRRLDSLSQNGQKSSTEELRDIYTSWLPRMMEEFESIIYQARLSALNSQLRMNIAERALEALEIHGFRLHEAGYVNQDMQAPFVANLANQDGSRVTIRVLPKDQRPEDLANELIVITNHPYLKTEHEARLQWEELSRSLVQFNLNVSPPTVGATLPARDSEIVEPRPAPSKTLVNPKKHHYV